MDRRRFLLASLAAGRSPPRVGAAEDAYYSGFRRALGAHPWLAAFQGVDGDLSADDLRVEGRIPKGLRGTLYRNGPALFERDGVRYHHLFDGDGMVQAYRFTDQGVAHRGRFVRTRKFVAEGESGRFLYPGFRHRVREGILRLRGQPRGVQRREHQRRGPRRAPPRAVGGRLGLRARRHDARDTRRGHVASGPEGHALLGAPEDRARRHDVEHGRRAERAGALPHRRRRTPGAGGAREDPGPGLEPRLRGLAAPPRVRASRDSLRDREDALRGLVPRCARVPRHRADACAGDRQGRFHPATLVRAAAGVRVPFRQRVGRRVRRASLRLRAPRRRGRDEGRVEGTDAGRGIDAARAPRPFDARHARPGARNAAHRDAGRHRGVPAHRPAARGPAQSPSLALRGDRRGRRDVARERGGAQRPRARDARCLPLRGGLCGRGAHPGARSRLASARARAGSWVAPST